MRTALLVLLALAGCDDMTQQAKQKAYARVTPTQPVGAVRYAEKPVPVPALTLALLERGQQRFRIDCVPCHGETGAGNGMVVQRGLSAPPSYDDERLRAAPTRHFYDVITNGHGAMYSYAERVAPADRWAIAAYIRALQLAPRVAASDLTPAERAGLP